MTLLLVASSAAQELLQPLAEELIFKGESQALQLLRNSSEKLQPLRWSLERQAKKPSQTIESLRAQALLVLYEMVDGESPDRAPLESFQSRALELEQLIEKANQDTLRGDMAAVNQTVEKGGDDLYTWVNWSRAVHLQGPRADKLNVVYAMSFIANSNRPVVEVEQPSPPGLSGLAVGLPYNGPSTEAEARSGLADSSDWRVADYLARIGAYSEAVERLSRLEPSSPLVSFRSQILKAQTGLEPLPDTAPQLGPDEEIYWLLARLRESEARGDLKTFLDSLSRGLKLSADKPLYEFCFYSASQRLARLRGEVRDVPAYEQSFRRGLEILKLVDPKHQAPPLVWRWVGESLDDWERGWQEMALGFPALDPLQREIDLISIRLFTNPEFERANLWKAEAGTAVLSQRYSSIEIQQKAVESIFGRIPHLYNTRAGLVQTALAENQLPGQPEAALSTMEKGIRLLKAGPDRNALDNAVLRKAEIILDYNLEKELQEATSIADEYSRSANLQAKIRALFMLARILELQGVRQEAMETLDQAVQLLNQFAVESEGGAWTLEQMKRRYSPIFELRTVWLLEADRVAEAVANLEKQNLLQKVASTPLSGQPELNWKKQQIHSLEEKLGQTDMPEKQKAVRAELEVARRGLVQLLAGLQSHPNYRKLLVTKPAEISAIQASLPDDTVLIQHFLAQNRSELYILVIGRSSLDAKKYALNSADLERDILNLRRALRGRSVTDQKLTYGLLNKLYNQLLKPVESELAGKKRLLLATSGSLNNLPFSALVTGATNGKPRFLVEDYEIVSLLRSGDLARLQNEPPPNVSSWTVFGNPDGTLPAAELETEFIKKLHPESKTFVRNDARELRLRELVAETGVLHLATHGRLNDRNPAQSSLLLIDEVGRPGALTRQEIISDLDLRKARLVTLSACETALSGQSGNEVSSLADAFWSKGARSVIGSLWSVPDEPTYRLMATYYQGLASDKSYGQAFRDAQLALIADQKTFHPLFWSGFIFWGDFR